MKKIFFLQLFFLVIIFLFPSTALGVVTDMEITVTITSLQIPERAAMILVSDRPNTEFQIDGARIAIVKNSDGVVQKTADFPSVNPYQRSAKKNASITFSFPYVNSMAPFNVYLEIAAVAATVVPGGGMGCRADCSNIPNISDWYLSSARIYYLPSGGGTPVLAGCPNPPCTYPPIYDTPYQVAFAKSNIVNGYWRSPSILTIN